MKGDFVLPKVYIVKGEKRYDLHWDDNSIEADKIIDENHDYLLGYFRGALESVSDGKENIACISSNTGAIYNLSKDNAEKLMILIKAQLHPLVEKRYKEIQRYNNLPHVKYAREGNA